MGALLFLTLLLTGFGAMGRTGQGQATDGLSSSQHNAGGYASVDGISADGIAPAEPPAGSRAATPSTVVVLDGAVDERPDAAFANLVRADFVGCRDLRARDCGRLATFRFEYCWESAERLEMRLKGSRLDLGGNAGSNTSPDSTSWVSSQTDSQGRAGLPLPPELAGVNVLHVRLKEPGWDWFTFPGAIHPGTLDGAAAFEVQSGSRNVRVTLVGGSRNTDQ